MNWEYGVILLGYASLLIELGFFHVPSVASNVNIMRKKPSVVQGYSASFQQLFQSSLPSRFLLSMLPLLLVWCVFAWPVLVMANIMTAPQAFSQAGLWLGCALIFMGRLITFSSVLIIRVQNTQQDDSFRLHTDFLFARSRNPGLLGMYIFMFGIWLLMPSLLFLLGLGYYMAYMHFKVLMEEDFLTQKFGASYLEYKTSTGRYWS